MISSDPIADMLLRIRNAQMAGHEKVEIPGSRIKGEIARILKKEGFIGDYAIEGGSRKVLRLYLKYTEDGKCVIRGMKRISTSGLRRYANVKEVPNVLSGMGIAILSTSAGIMTNKEARKRNVGGEVICEVW